MFDTSSIALKNLKTQSENGIEFSVNDDSKIINGKPAKSGAYPFIASLGFANTTHYFHMCGANIIDNTYIWTAAHCVKELGNKYDPESFFKNKGRLLVVITGIDSLDLSKATDMAKIYIVERVTYNTKYIRITDPFDIAVLRLMDRIEFNSRTKPVERPSSTKYDVVFGKKLTAIGWGVTETGKLSEKLMMTELTVINKNNQNNECNGLDDSFYCIKDLTSTHSSSCFGDSGGPLVIEENGKWVLYGLTSFGLVDEKRRCKNTAPSFYSMVPSLQTWALEQMKN